jgi:hypothetical protein
MLLLPGQELSLMKSRDAVRLECEHCHAIFVKEKHFVQAVLRGENYRSRLKFCSSLCSNISRKTAKIIKCGNCGKETCRLLNQLRKSKSGKSFCSHSCAGIYSNTHKTIGIRRSKMEKWIEERLKILLPDLYILFNDKQTIESELDIYIPSLQLAFELNGIHHKKPIYGDEKLARIQSNDVDKIKRCIEKNILLMSIDTSAQSQFSPKTSEMYLEEIIGTIRLKQSHATHTLLPSTSYCHTPNILPCFPSA